MTTSRRRRRSTLARIRRPFRSGVRGWRSLGDARAALIVALVSALGAINGIANEFTLDDDGVIAKNDLLHHVSGIWRTFAHPYWPETTPAGQYRPLATASFALDWVLSGGSPQWMHFVNLLWHVAACVLVWRLLRDILSPESALAGALYFALQPVHVEAIANTVGRCDVMSAAFVVAGVLAHRRGRWFAVPLYALALASKEMGIVMIGLVAANDLVLGGVGRAPPLAAAQDKAPASTIPLHGVALWRARRGLYAGYLVVAALYGATLALVFRHGPMLEIAPAWYHTSTIDRWLTAARVVPEYVRLMVVPFELRIEYSPPAIDVARSVTVLVALGFAIVAASVSALIYCWKRAPVVAMGIAWFVIAVSPVTNIVFASGVVLAERTLYLPSVGAAMLVACLAAFLARRLALVGRQSRTRRRYQWRTRRLARAWRVIGALGSVVLVSFAIRSWTRIAVWHDAKRLVLTSLELEPDSYRTHVRAAVIFDHRHDWASAERELAIARTLYPEDPYVYEGAAMVADNQDEFELADRLYDSASRITPGVFGVYIKQARLRYRAGDYAGAIESARTAYTIARDSLEALNILTGAAQQINDFADADWAFKRGLSDHPTDTALHRQYSWMLAAMGDTAASRREAARAAGQRPAN